MYQQFINEWNLVPEEIKTSESVLSFMNELKNKKENSLPPYFSCGNRRLNIIHTRLRHNCILDKNLFCCNINNSPLCTCGKLEDDLHALNIKMPEIFYSIVYLKFKICTVLLGDNCLNISENQHLFTVVQAFIKHSGHFDSYVLRILVSS
jgi:hypothetical protein